MPILDFKEISEAHIASGKQEQFELFTRDYLEYVGYEVLSSPSRGADGGVDLLVLEKRTGIGGETQIKWLVSCKHKAHGGKSVTPTIEVNISDRVQAHECHGFIGFYSTVPSSGLLRTLEGLKVKMEVQIYDNEKIEDALLNSLQGLKIAERYFPKSIKIWHNIKSQRQVFDSFLEKTPINIESFLHVLENTLNYQYSDLLKLVDFHLQLDQPPLIHSGSLSKHFPLLKEKFDNLLLVLTECSVKNGPEDRNVRNPLRPYRSLCPLEGYTWNDVDRKWEQVKDSLYASIDEYRAAYNNYITDLKSL